VSEWEWVNEWMRVNEWVSEWISEWICEWVNEWVNESICSNTAAAIGAVVAAVAAVIPEYPMPTRGKFWVTWGNFHSHIHSYTSYTHIVYTIISPLFLCVTLSFSVCLSRCMCMFLKSLSEQIKNRWKTSTITCSNLIYLLSFSACFYSESWCINTSE